MTGLPMDPRRRPLDPRTALDRSMSYDGTHPHRAAAEARWRKPKLTQGAKEAALDMFVPGAGMALSARDAGQAWQDGRYAAAAFNAALAGADAFPLLGIFAGVGAKTADLAKLATAKEMAETGSDAKSIWDKTGWFQGADDKWRFEIPDESSVYKQPADKTVSPLGEVLEHKAFFDAYPAAKDVDVARMNVDARGAYHSGGLPSTMPGKSAISLNSGLDEAGGKSTLLHEIQHYVQGAEGFDRGSNLTQAPYDARNYAFEIKSSPAAQAASAAAGKWGMIRAGEGEPLWNATYLDSLDRLTERGSAGTLKPRDIFRQSDWYEVADDYRSAAGPMPKRAGAARDDWLHGAAIALRRNHLSKMSPGEQALMQEAISKYPTPRDRKNASARVSRKLSKYYPALGEVREIKERAAGFDELSGEPYEAYRRVSGEVEARNVQGRADLSRLYREGKAPFETQEFPFSEQIRARR